MKLTNEKLENFRKEMVNFTNSVFISFLIGYLVLYVSESLVEGFVSNFFDLNIFLWILGISGAILVIFKEEYDLKKTKKFSREKIFVFFIGIIGGLVVYFQTIEIGYTSIFLGIITAVIIILLSFLLLNDFNK
jgi:hypothetical protein